MVFCSIAIEMKDHGGGINVVDVPDSELKIFTKHYQDVQMIARTSIFFAKLAILLLYIRIFYPKGTYRTALWWVIQAVIWLNLLYTVSLILAISLQCVPFNRPFGTSCANQYAILLSASTINTISDIAVLVIPMGSLWKLQMSRNKKLSVWALFAFGALAPLFSITRLLYQITQASGDNKTVIAETVLLLALAEQGINRHGLHACGERLLHQTGFQEGKQREAFRRPKSHPHTTLLAQPRVGQSKKIMAFAPKTQRTLESLFIGHAERRWHICNE